MNTESNLSDLSKLQNSWVVKRKNKKMRKGSARLSRSWQGDVMLCIILIAFALFSAYPLVFTIANAFKPLNELFLFPPKLFPSRIVFDNFIGLFNLMANSSTPITRYLFNTVFITIIGTSGHILFAAMCAYPLAKHKFPGKAFINQLIIYSLMFSGAVTGIPTYIIVSKLGLLDSHWAIILPSFGFTLGLFLMRQFMVTIPTELLEAAKVDGASELYIFRKIIMPLVKPAWLTVLILLFQSLWSNDGGSYIFTDTLKPLSYALSQIVAGGVARTGEAAAVTVIMLIVPISVFIISQSRIIDTMSHSGIK